MPVTGSGSPAPPSSLSMPASSGLMYARDSPSGANVLIVLAKFLNCDCTLSNDIL